jgi:hypothetical protein
MAKKLWSTKAHETPEFVEFWESWRPHARETDGRGDARDTFLEHVKRGADPHDIVAGAKWFLRNLRDRDFIPLASSWLNKRSYEDHAEQYRAYEARKAERQRAQEQSTNIVSIDPERRAEMVARTRGLFKAQEA